jgi:pantoate--beta-alanine ligase
MGYLHEGHLALLREGRRRVPPEQGELVLSIFVNPTQFDDGPDLDAYPRDEEGDLDKARDCGVSLAFCPESIEQLYPSGRGTWVEVKGLDERLCGATRPGHFRGVCTVVAKLWGLVRPDVSFFGEKDYQQLAILRRLNAELFLPGEVVGVPTVRERDGLAMSSRNARLSTKARAQALAIPRLLRTVKERFDAGERSVAALLEGAGDLLSPGRADYVEIVDAEDLSTIDTIERVALCAVAAFYGGVRLIDNTVLRP